MVIDNAAAASAEVDTAMKLIPCIRNYADIFLYMTQVVRVDATNGALY